jgi:hypothetical protein
VVCGKVRENESRNQENPGFIPLPGQALKIADVECPLAVLQLIV